MAARNSKLATLLALMLMISGVGLAATDGDSPLSTPIAPFGCGA